MKVQENGSDRIVEAHIHIEGKVDALEEYGEHIDPKDEAICCYIPVNEGDILKIWGRFTGKTLVIAYDAVIDGVCRKAGASAAKSVQQRKSFKLDLDTFLVQASSAGVLDTNMRVAQLDKTVQPHKDGPDMVGAIELHIHVTRQLGIEHDLNRVQKYNEIDCSTSRDVKITSSTQIKPEYIMAFEENCGLLEKKKLTLELKRINAKRPGTEPWAVFRFYYRNKDSILEQKMKMTFDPTIKTKDQPAPRLLEMEPVPDLPIGTTPATNDGDNSTRTSSIPPEVPSTPIKNPLNPSTPKSATPSSRKRSKPAMKMAVTDTSSIEHTLASSAKESTSGLPKETKEDVLQSQLSSRTQRGHLAIKSSQPRLQNTPSSPLAKPAPQANVYPPTAHTGIVQDTTTAATDPFQFNGDSNEKILEPTKDSTNKASKVGHKKPFEKHTAPAGSTEKLASREKRTDSPLESSHVDDHAGATDTITKSADPTTESKERPGNFPRLPGTPTKKPAAKPKPIVTSAQPAQKKTPVPTTPTTPTKRPADTASNHCPELKRTKITATPPPPTSVPQTALASPNPHSMSIELQVAEQRKRLDIMRKKRQDMAQKQITLDKEMVPYKQRMFEELEKLNQAMEDEERAFAEEEERFSASVEMLEEFKSGGA